MPKNKDEVMPKGDYYAVISDYCYIPGPALSVKQTEALMNYIGPLLDERDELKTEVGQLRTALCMARDIVRVATKVIEGGLGPALEDRPPEE